MKAVDLPVSEKNFEVCFHFSYVQTCRVLTLGASYEQIW